MTQICGDSTCEGPGCSSESLDEWFRRQEVEAREIVQGVLAFAAKELQGHALARFGVHGSSDVRGAALWDAARHLVEKLGDGGEDDRMSVGRVLLEDRRCEKCGDQAAEGAGS